MTNSVHCTVHIDKFNLQILRDVECVVWLIYEDKNHFDHCERNLDITYCNVAISVYVIKLQKLRIFLTFYIFFLFKYS